MNARLASIEEVRKLLVMELEKIGSLTPDALDTLNASVRRLKDDFENAKRVYNEFVRALESASLWCEKPRESERRV